MHLLLFLYFSFVWDSLIFAVMNILPAFSFVIDGVLFSFSNMNMKYSNTACSRVLNILSHHLHCEDISGQRDNAAAAKSHQSCPTLCDPIDGSPPGSPFPWILQGRTLEWVTISFSNAWKWKVKVKSLSRVWHFETPWTAAHQAPLSMGFSRQEYWSRLLLPSLQRDNSRRY